MKRHPVTGELVPDETARTAVLKYINPRKAEWPKADYVVGNPPFIGTARMRDALGDGYTVALRSTYREIPESCDYVMYWWNNTAELAQNNSVIRFGLIATNSLRQTFSRRVVSRFLEAETQPVSLSFAVPDHPWVDSEDGAAVRISMTVGLAGEMPGLLRSVKSESYQDDRGATLVFEDHRGTILADLSVGAQTNQVFPLLANSELSCRGVTLFGSGFILNAAEYAATSQLEKGRIARSYLNGRDVNGTSRNVYVIDFFGLSEEQSRKSHPDLFQRILSLVKPERDQNNRASYREKWWIHGEPRATLRASLSGLKRYIVTVETSKHRFFVFLSEEVLPDNMLVAIALEDAYYLGVMSARSHLVWALKVGGRLGVGNDPRYNKSRCFEPFPFPDCTDELKARIRELGEQLDAHRKRQQAAHPKLTLTDMYNVLEKLRSGEELNAKDKRVHEESLVSVLKEIHDRLDAAVFEAYGWPRTLSDAEILERLVALNAERAAEEARGLVRWLRPEFQCPALPADSGARVVQTSLAMPEEADSEQPEPAKKTTVATGKKPAWPKHQAERTKAIQAALAAASVPLTSDDLAKQFSRARGEAVADILEALTALGLARRVRGGKYVASA